MQIQPSWRKRILFSGWKKGKKRGYALVSWWLQNEI
jgi:hypothetical protein